jgi:hypothetical protein
MIEKISEVHEYVMDGYKNKINEIIDYINKKELKKNKLKKELKDYEFTEIVDYIFRNGYSVCVNMKVDIKKNRIDYKSKDKTKVFMCGCEFVGGSKYGGVL